MSRPEVILAQGSTLGAARKAFLHAGSAESDPGSGRADAADLSSQKVNSMAYATHPFDATRPHASTRRQTRSSVHTVSALAGAAMLSLSAQAWAQDGVSPTAASPAPIGRSADTPDRRPAQQPSENTAGKAEIRGGAAVAASSATLERVTVTGRAEPTLQAAGFADSPLSRLPAQASVLTRDQMLDLGTQRLADLTRTDASVSDAYNTEGYWDYLTVRGFVIDNRFNYRRDGLPISAETSIALDNKERIEVLRGTSGLQAGTSAPGGLVNLVVKRPTEQSLRSISLGWRERNTWAVSADINERFGSSEDASSKRPIGLRVNAAAETLNPAVRNARGERSLVAVAGEWRISSRALLEAEIEHSHRSQPSVPGFSLLGNALPAAGDGRTNLNNQPWTLPVVLDGDTASLRFTQRLDDTPLGDGGRLTVHLARQQLVSQDRAAFPYGCSKEDQYDRYCSDGSFDLYDYRSENERRKTDALDVSLQGQVELAGMRHRYTAGVLSSRVTLRFQDQAYNYAGEGRIDGSAITPPAPELTDPNTNRDERSTEWYVRDAIQLSTQWSAWAGLRHSRIERQSRRTSGSPRALDTTQAFTTPWLALGYQLSANTLVYASAGRGVESEAVPNRARYTNAAQAYASTSRQLEFGVKHEQAGMSAGLNVFDIARPQWADLGTNCGSDTPGRTCTRQIDGQARHRGLEAQFGIREGAWSLGASGLWLQARREGSAATPELNGKRPPNVPANTFKLLARHDVFALPGLSIQGNWVSEGSRTVLPDNSVSIPRWSRLDVGARYAVPTSIGRLTLRAGIDNLLDQRAWRESPLQFGHVYLFPQPGRTARASLEWAF
jgi:iron complex outermembrane receptor protein